MAQHIQPKISHEQLLSPLKIGNRTVKNRIVSSAHAVGFDNGRLNEKHVRYQERKAEGGAGLIMTFGSASVYQDSSASYGSVSLWDSENEPFLSDLANRVHAHDALLISQATHMGRRGSSSISGRPLQAPSAIPEGVHREVPHVLRTEEIEPIIEAFANAARRLERCGWDGIELTSFGGHLIEQFWSPALNKRSDHYGGSFENRMRFSVEVIEAVAAAVSDNFVIAFRMACDLKTDELELNADELLQIATYLDALGHIDLFNISGGTGADYSAQAAVVPGDTYARSTFNSGAARMKEQLSVPVLVAGRILEADEAEQALVSQQCDLVAMTRAIIADPDLPKKVLEQNTSSIRPCIACSEGCIGRVYFGKPMICTVNPAIKDDHFSSITPTSGPIKHIIIIGGGPAGLEAARTSAIRGHHVTLFERASTLGGQVLAAQSVTDRPHYGLHVEWLIAECKRLNVDVRFNETVNVDTLSAIDADEVIVAVGSKPELPYISTLIPIVTDADVLTGQVRVPEGGSVYIQDREGYYRGVSIANYVKEKGASTVELATPYWSVAVDLDEMQKPALYKKLGNHKVTLSANKELVQQENGGLYQKDIWSQKQHSLDSVDLIILVGYERGTNTLYEQLTKEKASYNVHLIGSAIAPRRLSDAVHEGMAVSMNL
ncbi:hypothetical protein DH09_13805 [Bacillaceae bacterium JMAK1]|nr:hypothetical protein DH09_13805 [Bacillaceae bacterium JMAK1]